MELYDIASAGFAVHFFAKILCWIPLSGLQILALEAASFLKNRKVESKLHTCINFYINHTMHVHCCKIIWSSTRWFVKLTVATKFHVKSLATICSSRTGSPSSAESQRLSEPRAQLRSAPAAANRSSAAATRSGSSAWTWTSSALTCCCCSLRRLTFRTGSWPAAQSGRVFRRRRSQEERLRCSHHARGTCHHATRLRAPWRLTGCRALSLMLFSFVLLDYTTRLH